MARTEMAASNGTNDSSEAAQWSDLPEDILGMVRFMVSSLRDRARLAAVCKPWRGAASRLPAPPAVPLLLLSPDSDGRRKHLCSPDESWVLRVPDKVVNMRFAGSHSDGWISAVDNFELVIVNLFSGSEVVARSLRPDRSLWRNPVAKIIFSQAPATNGCMLATITDDWRNIALCNVGRGSGWTTKGWHDKKLFRDITFCGGDLYGLLHRTEELIKFRIGMEEDGTPVITSMLQLAIQRRDGPMLHDDSTYILELQGELLMAVRTRWLPNRKQFFKVFKLVNADVGESYAHKWEEVTNFGNYALFLGPMSMAVHVPVGAERRGLERNHIYYSTPTYSRENQLPGDEVYSVTSDDGVRMYCREDQDIDDGVKRTGYYILGWHNTAMWIYPPNL